MDAIVQLCEKLSHTDEMTVIPDVTVQEVYYPLIAVHESGIFVFFEAGDLAKNKAAVLDSVYLLQRLLSLSRTKMHIYSVQEDGSWTYLNPCDDSVEDAGNGSDHVAAIINSNVFLIDQNRAAYYAQKLMFGACCEQVKSMPDGNTYVKRGSHWYPASLEDQDDVYMKTCLYGVFGWLPFHRGRHVSAFLYALTCGLFGVGWLLDVLSLLLGAARADEGKYFQPLSDTKRSWLMFLFCILAAILLLAAYRFLLSVLNHGFVFILRSASSGMPLEQHISTFAG